MLELFSLIPDPIEEKLPKSDIFDGLAVENIGFRPLFPLSPGKGGMGIRSSL